MSTVKKQYLYYDLSVILISNDIIEYSKRRPYPITCISITQSSSITGLCKVQSDI